MGRQLRLLAPLAYVSFVIGARVKRGFFEETKSEEDKSAEDHNVNGVDFKFMTTDYKYHAYDPGFFGTITEWFGGRATSDDVKDEIVAGHSCAKRGNRDETYYASSFCYWLPEIEDRGNNPQDAGLTWKGGTSNSRKLGRKLSARGKCMRAAVCHNNARDEDGHVSRAVFAEEIQMPSSCMKEQEIERQCVSKYDSEVAPLKAEDTRCHEVLSRWEVATNALNQCIERLQTLPREISSYPHRIQKAEHEVIRLEERYRSSQDTERRERSHMHSRCRTYERLQGNLRFMNMLMGASSTEQILSYSSFYCRYPHRPFDNGDGNNWDEMQRYRNNMEIYHACQECDNAKNDLQRANSNSQRVYNEKNRAERRVPALRRELQQKEAELASWKSQESGLRADKDTMDSEWFPQNVKCENTFGEYKNGKAASVAKCAPTYYDESCEKACVEKRPEDGCGTVEGSHPHDEIGNGGVSVSCAPPQPSWILGPFTYGAQEQLGQQCKRIEATQKVQYAQSILKTGWLWKKGRVNGWDKRFYALESGDAVRSPVLRYWSDDPSKISNAEEHAGKGIILRDAKGVKAKDGTHYGFDKGEECFKLYHFYRDFRFCTVVADDGTFHKGHFSSDDRDEWMNLIADSIDK